MSINNHTSPEHEAQQELLFELMKPQPILIGADGGPCGGKTTLAEALAEASQHNDRQVVILPEAATPIIEKLNAQGVDIGWLAQNDREGYIAFETDVLKAIIENARQFKEAFAGTDTIGFTDRADIKAYVTNEEYEHILARLGMPYSPSMTMLDKLVYLPSVAMENPALYEFLKTTNQARYETLEEAQQVCKNNLAASSQHPEFEIAWGGNFDDKISRLTDMILHPELEGEIKQSVNDVTARTLLEQARREGNLLGTTTITQAYHECDGLEYRLRRMVGGDGIVHRYFTVKTGQGAFRQEVQRSIDQKQYTLLAQAPLLGKPLTKNRHSILEQPDATGERRLWYADQYLQPEIGDWHFETTIHDDEELALVELSYPDRTRIHTSAKQLIYA